MCTQDVTLRCDSQELATASLAAIFQTTIESLNTYFSNYEAPGTEQVDTVITSFHEKYPNALPLTNVIFFHGTRAFTQDDDEARRIYNENGIYALPNTSEELWTKLRRTLAQENLTDKLWDEFKTAFHTGQLNNLYNATGRSNGEQGPFGYLIQEQMTAENCHGNYAARGSEFITDICSKFDNHFEWATNSYRKYIEKTKGVIVAFSTKNHSHDQVQSYISSCIEYVWRSQHGEGGEIWAASYDGGGNDIPPEDIILSTIIPTN